MGKSFVKSLFYEEPAGTFSQGYILIYAPDRTSAKQDPDIGYWHCDFADHDKLTWSGKKGAAAARSECWPFQYYPRVEL